VCGKALELWQVRESACHLAFLPTFLVELDIVLHGGLLTGSITEVCDLFSGYFDMCMLYLYYSACVHIAILKSVKQQSGVVCLSV